MFIKVTARVVIIPLDWIFCKRSIFTCQQFLAASYTTVKCGM